MSGHNIEGDYIESLNDDYSDFESVNSENSEVSNLDFTDFSFLLSQQHFLVRFETLRVFIFLSLARYIISWHRANDIYSLILNNMVRLICVENGLDLSVSSFSWVVFSDNSLIDLNFQTVVEAYGYNPSHEDFSLKTFLEQEIIFLDLSSGPDHSPDIPEEPGYRYSSDDSDDSMVVESNEISCEYFDGQNFSYLDDYKCRFCKRCVCNCWNSFSSIDDVDSDFDY
ncbi:17909_t:CDS:2, partial [Gigaspora margarita]